MLIFSSVNKQIEDSVAFFIDAAIRCDIPRMSHTGARVVSYAARVVLLRLVAHMLGRVVSPFFLTGVLADLYFVFSGR